MKLAVVIGVVLLLSAALSAGQEYPDGTVVRTICQNHIDVIAATFGFLSPAGTARALAMVTAAMWDAATPYTEDLLPNYADNGITRRPSEEHTEDNIELALAVAALKVMEDLFVDQDQALLVPARAVVTARGGDPDVSEGNAQTPEGIGYLAARGVLNARHGDGMNQLGDEDGTGTGAEPYSDYTLYSPVNDPQPTLGRTDCAALRDINKWQPLRIPTAGGGEVVRSFLSPYMAQVRPFSGAIGSLSDLRPPSPPAMGTSSEAEFIRQHTEVLTVSGALDDRSKVVAEFWADGPDSSLPPGHWHGFAIELAEDRGLGLIDSLKLVFLQAQAVLDAGIIAWDTKRFYDSARPVTVIQCLFENQDVTAWQGPYMGVGTINGSHWQPYQDTKFVTPPFAEYVSGHSTFSYASAEVFRSFFGSDDFGGSYTVAAGESLFEPAVLDASDPEFVDGVTNVANTGPNTVGYVPAADVTLSWATFTEAAAEAGESRIFGGIHIEAGDIKGRELGTSVGKRVWEKYLTLLGASACSSGDVTVQASLSSSEKNDVLKKAMYGSLAGSAIVSFFTILIVSILFGCGPCSRPAGGGGGGGGNKHVVDMRGSSEVEM